MSYTRTSRAVVAAGWSYHGKNIMQLKRTSYFLDLVSFQDVILLDVIEAR